jgi:hypothetical protein
MFRTGFGKADQYLFSPDEMKKIKGFLHGYRDYVRYGRACSRRYITSGRRMKRGIAGNGPRSLTGQ